MSETRFRCGASDGATLGATVYRPARETTERNAVFFAAAMGVTQESYRPLATWLSGRGWSVVTFDYRGLGASRDAAPVRDITFDDWGRRDLAAVIDWITNEVRPHRLVAITHSIGGQLLPFAANHGRIDAMVAVASQKGYFRLWRGYRRAVLLGFYAAYVPLVVRLYGRLPLGFVGLADLPPEVARDWARWGLCDAFPSREAPGEPAPHEQFEAPILALSFEDDPLYAPRRAVDHLFERFYRRAAVERRHLVPSALGLREIGHSGFFDPAVCPSSLWEETEAWMSSLRVRAVEVTEAAEPRIRQGF